MLITTDRVQPVTIDVSKVCKKVSQQFYIRRQNHEKRHNSAGRWWMFLLFVGTTDVEQIGLELSFESYYVIVG